MKTLDVLFDPYELFKRLDQRPIWLKPFLIVVAAGLVSTFLMSPVFMHIMAKQMPEGMSAETQQQMTSMVKMTKYYGVLATPFIVLVKWSICAFLLYAVSVICGADITYRKILSLFAHASLITALDNLLSIGVLYIRGIDSIAAVEDVHSTVLSLNHFWGSPDHPAMRVLLESVNVLSLWYLVVLALGIASMTKLSKKLSVVVVVTVWTMQTAFMMGVAMIFSHARAVSA